MNRIQCLRTLCLAFIALSFVACKEDPICIVMHAPLYPSGGQSVTYTVQRVSPGAISSAKFFEQVSTLNASGSVTTTGTETLIHSWPSPSGDLSFTKTGGYNTNQLVHYRFEITTSGGTKNFRVTFAIRPFPDAGMPVPVYCQGAPDDVMDVVFIPDNDITNLQTFRDHVRKAILESFFDEKTLREWRQSFNFYINPDRGTATDYDKISTDGLHQPPVNYSNLSFAEGKVLMHQEDLRDYAHDGLFSTEMQKRGTILHECGHSLFGLADEYCDGVHAQNADFPNNWSSLAGARAAAGSYDKTDADARQICGSGWYKLCNDDCQMNTTGLYHTTYDRPCKERIDFVVFDNAIH